MNTKSIVFLIIAIVLFAGLFFLFKPKSSSQVNTADTNELATTTLTSKTLDIIVKDKKIVSGGDNLKVTEGDSVVMKFTLDQKEEIHLHGYDKSVELEKDTTGEISFIANLTGRFPFELEGSGTELGSLEVSPK